MTGANGVIEVYSINGRCVYSGTETSISGLGKGVYIVKVKGQTFNILL